MKSKRTLNRLVYLGVWYNSARNTGKKSKQKFQKLIDSGQLNTWGNENWYTQKER